MILFSLYMYSSTQLKNEYIPEYLKAYDELNFKKSLFWHKKFERHALHAFHELLTPLHML